MRSLPRANGLFFGAATSDRISVYPEQRPLFHPIRGIVLEGVWALVKSGKGPLCEKYEALSGRMNKRKSAVAIARKMVSLAWLLMKRREYYRGMNSEALGKKLRYYKIEKLVEEAVSA
ncbi:MAG: hypothetical protein LBI90_04190 [Treponema sp.]|jgi:hypothetical protein|nr:hypothetical protein [Treponema sp.]